MNRGGGWDKHVKLRAKQSAILYDDASLIALDKPAGLLAVPDRWDKGADNLIRMVHERISPHIYNVHRLDRETSGILLCTKTRPALRQLVRDFAERRVAKRYVALVNGIPPWGETTVKLPLGPDPAHPGRVVVRTHGGKPAETRLRVVERWRSYALVEAFPQTGRTHQIRVHLASTGHPIVGDTLYGDGRGIYLSHLKRGYKHKNLPERPLIGRLALHAEALTFTHPDTSAETTLRAPCPRDFTVAMKYLTRFDGGPSSAREQGQPEV